MTSLILVTGGAGAIGTNLVIALSNLVGEDGKIIILDNLSAIKGDEPIDLPPLANMMFVRGDIRSDIDLKRVFREKPTLVYHLAAFFANQNSVDYPEKSSDVDIKGIIKLLDLAQFTGVEKFVYASSGCAIYGSYGEMPLKEDFISMHLTTPYQINKMAGEMYCNFYHHHYGLNVVNCRFFNSFGPGDFPGRYKGVIPNFINLALKNEPLVITGTGEETRSFTYVQDVVNGTIASAVKMEAIGQTINIGSNKELRVIDLAEKIKSIVGGSSQIEFTERRSWDRIKVRKASMEKAERILEYSQTYDLDQGLKLTIDWMKNQNTIPDTMGSRES